MNKNKFDLHQVVKFAGKPGHFVVIGLIPGESGYAYTLIPKAKYDEAEKRDTYPEDTVFVAEVEEKDISPINKFGYNP